jgi:glycosyltransferase involved in cell wall biosynthesis
MPNPIAEALLRPYHGSPPVLVIEPIRWEMEHVPINSALLKVCRAAWPDRPILLAAEATHLHHLGAALADSPLPSLNQLVIGLPPRHSSAWARWVADFRLVNTALGAAAESGAAVIFSSVNATLLWAIRNFLGKNPAPLTVDAILHSLSQLLQPVSLNPVNTVFHIRTALKFIGADHRLQLLALESGIARELQERFPRAARNIKVFEHPLPLDTGNNPGLPEQGPIRFGFLGLATRQKGLFKFLAAAAETTRRFPGRAEFHLVGRLHESYAPGKLPDLQVLATGPAPTPLERAPYVARLQKLHYVCLFFERDYYRLTASGVLLDCIAYEIPIISRRIPIVEDLTREFGEIGYLCEPADYAGTIAAILEHPDPEAYSRQVANLRRVKASRSPEALAQKLRALHHNNGNLGTGSKP